MYFHAGEQDYEQATIERNRLQAVRALLERQRVANEGAGTYDAVAVDVDGTEANAQVFQVRDGVLSDRQSFYLDNQAEQGVGDRRRGVHPAVLRERALDPVADRRPGRRWRRARSCRSSSEILAERRGGARRDPRLRARRQAPHPRARRAQRAARARPGEAQGRAPPPAARRVARRACRRRSGSTRCRCAIECFDISHLGGTHTTASMVVFEGGAPKKSDYRRFNIREVEPGDDYGAMAEVLSRRYAQWEKQNERSPVRRRPRRVVRRAAERRRDRRRQGPARRRPRAAAGLPRARRRRSSRWPSGSRRSSCRAPPSRSCSRTTRRSCSCSSACATRRTGSRSPTTGSAATRR